MRLATLAQAMSSTMTATPTAHSSTRDSGPGLGPAALRSAATIARGRATESGSVRGLVSRWMRRLCLYALVSSAVAAASETPGFRLTSTSIQSQLYAL